MFASLTQLENFQESQTWEVCPDGGFWYPENYIALNRACKYPDPYTPFLHTAQYKDRGHIQCQVLMDSVLREVFC